MRARVSAVTVGTRRTSTRPMRSRPSALRVVVTSTSASSPATLRRALPVQKSRLAARQLPIAAASSRDGLGPEPWPSGGGSSVSRSGIPSWSKRTRNR